MAFVDGKKIVVFMPQTSLMYSAIECNKEKFNKKKFYVKKGERVSGCRSNSLVPKTPLTFQEPKNSIENYMLGKKSRNKSAHGFPGKLIQKNFNDCISGDLPKSPDFQKHKKRSLSRRPQHMSFRNLHKSETFRSKNLFEPSNHPASKLNQLYNLPTYLKVLTKEYLVSLKKTKLN